MEKNLAIIQGLTDADQANPIRITDAGELKVAIVSGGSSADDVSYDGGAVVNPITGNPGQYVNAPVFKNTDYNGMYSGQVKFGAGNLNVNDSDMKILVEQGKQFQTFMTKTYDASGFANSGDIDNAINDAIANQWIGAYGMRYDDIKITGIYVPGSNKTFINVTIIRYY